MNLFLWLISLGLAAATHTWSAASSELTDALAAASLENQLNLVSNGTLKTFLATQNVSQMCTEETVVRRKAYTALSEHEKLDYVRALQCLMDAPALTPSVRLLKCRRRLHFQILELTLHSCQDLIPGAKSRYDDFVGTHVNQTL